MSKVLVVALSRAAIKDRLRGRMAVPFRQPRTFGVPPESSRAERRTPGPKLRQLSSKTLCSRFSDDCRHPLQQATEGGGTLDYEIPPPVDGDHFPWFAAFERNRHCQTGELRPETRTGYSAGLERGAPHSIPATCRYMLERLAVYRADSSRNRSTAWRRCSPDRESR